MTITLTSPEQLNAVLAAMMPAKADAPKIEKAAPAPKAEAAATPSIAPAVAAPEPKAENSAAKPASRTIDEARALTMKIVADKGRDAAVEVLKKYGVPVAAKLAADQIDAFCTDAEAVLAS